VSLLESPAPNSLPRRDQHEAVITRLHRVVFDTVAFQTIPPEILAHNSMMRASRPLPLESWQAAVADCIGKGWLRCLDDGAVQEIRATLTGVEFVCDDEAIPRVGDVDFTPAGARLHKEILSGSSEGRSRLETPAVRVVSQAGSGPLEIEWYALRPSSVQEALYDTREGWAIELAQHTVLSTAQPEASGPWCSRWWNQHPSGYRFKAVLGV
jgi:hypothetical protein